MKSEHMIDWSKTAAEIEAAYTAMAEENDRLRVDVEKWRGLADANAVLTKVRQQRVDREERLGLVPNAELRPTGAGLSRQVEP